MAPSETSPVRGAGKARARSGVSIGGPCDLRCAWPRESWAL